MELKTVILNINQGYNEQLMKTCQTLWEYTEAVSRIRKFQKDLPIEDAVTYAIDECIADGILADFLRKNRREAIRVSVLECDVDKVMAYLQEEAKEIGYEEGFEKGFEKGKSEVLEKILESKIASIQALTKSLNMTTVQAMDVLNIPEEERELLSSRLEAQD